MMQLFAVENGTLVSLRRARLPKEEMLETWIVENPRILGLDVMVIGRQVVTSHGGKIDMLAIDADGYLTIVELKRDRTPRDVVAQILDYASWVSALSPKEVYNIASEYLQRTQRTSFEIAFNTAFGIDPPENLNSDHNMVIVASELDPASERIVEYLSETHGVSINTLFFSTFEDHGKLFMGSDWLMDQEIVVTRSVSKKLPPWSGFWYINVDDCKEHSWEDCRRCGFLAAGGRRKYSDQLNRLAVGDRVFAYQKKAGYVGYGIITQPAQPATEFMIEDKPLSECIKASPEFLHDSDEPDLQEYVVGVDWKKTVSVQEAKTFQGVFANPNVVCKLRDAETITFLKQAFEVPEESERAAAQGA